MSEPMRQELRKLLIKKRLENKSVTFVSEVKMHKDVDSAQSQELGVVGVNSIHIDKLPSATYEIMAKDTDGEPRGGLVISDLVV